MSGETKAHRELKRAALFWAQARGYRIAAMEVRVPNSAFRADVAAYGNGGKGEAEAAHLEEEKREWIGLGRTVVFECKQSRPDFLNDSRPMRETLEKLEALHERRGKLERQLGVHHPNLRKGETLFPEFDGYCFEELEHEGYRKLVREIRVLENRIYGKTKFERMIQYGCANLYYLVTAPGIMKAHEVPLSWGWLTSEGVEGDGDGEEGGTIRLREEKKPILQRISGERALALLHRLGMKGTGQINRAAGIDFEALWEAKRKEI